MRLVSWNVNGLRACIRKGFVPWALKVRPDVICLQETRLGDKLPAELEALEPHYRLHFSHAERKGYSGVGTFVRRDLGELPVHQGFGIPEYRAEGRTLVTEFPTFTLVNGYFPNGGQGPERLRFKLDYYADLLAWCCYQRGEGKSLVITGDLNTCHRAIDLARPKENVKNSGFMPIEVDALDRFMRAGFVDTFRLFHPEPEHYTWWSNRGGARERNVGWRLDYFLATRDLKERVTDATILPHVLGSDHCPISLTFAAP